jgi:transcriptional regulator with PAS, ATPase and Fis domain
MEFQVDPVKTSGPTKASPATNLKANSEMLEAQLIEDCLKRHKHNKSKTAQELGITRTTLYKKMEQYGIE